MYTFTVAIPPDAAERLRELARRERRSPRQQAAVLVLQGLDREVPAAAAPCGEEAAACPCSERDLPVGARR
jgi:predicted transcriptional regulator